VGFSLLLFFRSIFIIEISTSGDSTPFLLVPDSNLTSAFLILTLFKWLMLFFAESVDGFGPHEVLTLIRVCKPS
jgi:hypothetical protein